MEKEVQMVVQFENWTLYEITNLETNITILDFKNSDEDDGFSIINTQDIENDGFKNNKCLIKELTLILNSYSYYTDELDEFIKKLTIAKNFMRIVEKYAKENGFML